MRVRGYMVKDPHNEPLAVFFHTEDQTKGASEEQAKLTAQSYAEGVSDSLNNQAIDRKVKWTAAERRANTLCEVTTIDWSIP